MTVHMMDYFGANKYSVSKITGIVSIACFWPVPWNPQKSIVIPLRYYLHGYTFTRKVYVN